MSGPSRDADYGIVADLLESIEQNPYAVEARKLLAGQYVAFGWLDAAADEMRTVLQWVPDDPDAKALLEGFGFENAYGRKANFPSSSVRADSAKKSTPQDLIRLESGYRTLMQDAAELYQDLQIYQELCPSLDLAGHIADIKALAEGRSAAVLKVKKPDTARSVAAKMKQCKDDAARVDFLSADLESTARYLRSQSAPVNTNDAVRDSLRKRCEATKAGLPDANAATCDLAFMHIEHEVLGRKYQNEDNTTMLGDPISSIPRSNFWTSEDGYAWDMSELSQAIQANNGIMRNPLSKQMFTPADVKAIVTHPFGKSLAALQLKQSQLSNGVRPSTIDALDKMAKIMLNDQSADAAASRAAVDDFLAYVATLPEAEQSALRELRVPAKDSHTGREYDGSIGEAVDDAKANRQCFHKTGDLLGQAARWLRKKR